MTPTDLPDRARFEDKIIPVTESGCWLWTGNTLRLGYGLIGTKSRIPKLVHRVSWIFHRGQIPPGMFVCHKCDTRSCVNPDHLFLGTPRDNMHDMIAKGRQVYAKKYSDDVVLKVFSDPGTTREVAQKYGVSLHTVYKIKSGRQWSALTGKRCAANT